MIPNLRSPDAKLKHIDACLMQESQYQKTTGFESFTLPNQAGCSISLNDIDLTTTFCGRSFGAPLMISPMTGGVERGAELNRLWALVAERYLLPMSVGSQRIAIEKGDRAGFFQIRKIAPTAFIFANLGAGNLTKANAVDFAKRAVKMVEANGIFIHFNSIQEACQKRGDTDFSAALHCLELVCRSLSDDGVKVFAREVGFGLTVEAARRFLSTGVDGIDCSGAGGTSWSRVEAMCAEDASSSRLGAVFSEWGIPTSHSIRNVRQASEKVPLVASGGVRSGLDVAKALSLGADLAGMARPMLLAADSGEKTLFSFVEQILHETKVAMFGCGVTSVSDLKRVHMMKSDPSPVLD